MLSLEYCESFLGVHVVMTCERMQVQCIDYTSMVFLMCALEGELFCCNLLRISYHKTEKKEEELIIKSDVIKEDENLLDKNMAEYGRNN